MLLTTAKVSLFWLDGESDLPAAIQLLTWMGTYENAVRRVAVAYRLPTAVEIAIRGAGAHFYLATDDNVSALVDAWPRIEGRRSPALGPSALDSLNASPTTSDANFFPSEPP